jgi:regulator of PEP synthase PpsR (kinase-PPPase family)
MKIPSIIIVSGGVGYSAEQLVQTALAQFPAAEVRVERIPQVRRHEQLADAVEQAAAGGALIAHTLVDDERRDDLTRLAKQCGVATVDLIGPLLAALAAKLRLTPLGEPGRFDIQNRSYLDRIAAIDYTLAHDDGAHPEEWSQADVLLIGVSRVGKTPLATYLGVLGWKVANLPLVVDLPLPRELFELDRRKVIGLTIGLEQLIEHRRWRQRRLGMPLGEDYCSPATLSEELEHSDQLFRRCGFAVVDVTNKPLEVIANEVTVLLVRHAAYELAGS